MQTDNIHTVPKQRLTRYVGTLDSETMNQISGKIVLGLEGVAG